MSFADTLAATLADPVVLLAWAVVVAASLAVFGRHLRAHNARIAPLMKAVWTLTVLYSGPLGLAAYWYAGRRTIPEDTLWRRGVRSVAHCYSGCGAGEVVGVTVAAGLLALDGRAVALLTFACAYLLGSALTAGPLLQEGVGLSDAVRDTVYSETPSIVTMEVVAIGADRWLAASAHLGDVLFWTALVSSLALGFLAAYPVNVLLVRAGVKEGMQNPAET